MPLPFQPNIFASPKFDPKTAAAPAQKKQPAAAKYRVQQPPEVVVGRKPGFGDFLLGIGAGLFNMGQAQREAEQERGERERQEAVQQTQLELERRRTVVAEEESQRRASADESQARAMDFATALNYQKMNPAADMGRTLGILSAVRTGQLNPASPEGRHMISSNLGPLIDEALYFEAVHLQQAERIKNPGDQSPVSAFYPEAASNLSTVRDLQKLQVDQTRADLELRQDQLDALEKGQVSDPNVVAQLIGRSRENIFRIQAQLTNTLDTLIPKRAAAFDPFGTMGEQISGQYMTEQLMNATPDQKNQLIAGLQNPGIDPKVQQKLLQQVNDYLANIEEEHLFQQTVAARYPNLLPATVIPEKAGGEVVNPPPPGAGGGVETPSQNTFTGPDIGEGEGGMLSSVSNFWNNPPPGFQLGDSLKYLGQEALKTLGEQPTNPIRDINPLTGEVRPGAKTLKESTTEIYDGIRHNTEKFFAQDDAAVVRRLTSFIDRSITEEGKVNDKLLSRLGMTADQFENLKKSVLDEGGTIEDVRLLVLERELRMRGKTAAAQKIREMGAENAAPEE